MTGMWMPVNVCWYVVIYLCHFHITNCNAMEFFPHVISRFISCSGSIEGYLCLLQRGVLIFSVIFCIWLLAFFFGTKSPALSCSGWLSNWLEQLSLSWMLCSNTTLCESREVTTCLLEGVAMWVWVKVGVGVGGFTGHRMAHWAVMVYR